MARCQNKTAAFTLIEILVALMIFAIVGVLAAMGLRHLILVHDRLKVHDCQLNQLIAAVTRMRHDFLFVVNHAATGADGNWQSPLAVDGLGNMTFTRSGMVNPFAMEKRSDLARVHYHFAHHQIERDVWEHPDQAVNSHPVKQILLKNVSDWQLRVLTVKHQLVKYWPYTADLHTATLPPALPLAIIVSFKVQGMGQVQIVAPVVGDAYSEY